MCGICGEFRINGAPRVDPELLRGMTGLLSHRGPDDEGFHFENPRFLGLGHRRLSVIDLPGGKQPMSNEDGSIWIAYNGEVYNFEELRKDLIARGHRFRTASDTEVIIHQFEEDGPDCVKKFIGMFAIAIWDSKRRRLFLARDRLGIKPLYYHFEGSRFLFASELRPLLLALGGLPELDLSALWSFLVIRYTPAPRTLLTGVHKLLPGHWLVADAGGVRIERYWELPEGGEALRGRTAEESLLELFENAVKLRLIADVPLGAFLSGGVDSTALVAVMRKYKGEGLKTFSVDFHAEAGADYVNETRWSSLAARTYGADHHRLTVSARDAVDSLPVVAARLDDLVSDPAVIPTYLVSRFARERVTVVLSGEGGDELFAGYFRYALGALTRFYQPIPRPLRRLLFEWPAAKLPHMRRVRKGLTALSGATPAARHLAWLITFQPETAEALIGPDSQGRELVESVFEPAFAGQSKAFDLDRTLRIDLQSWLPDDLLTKVDRASMAVGLEARVPYLDHRLVELSMRIPPEEKLRLFQSKRVFKRALRGLVPEEIIRRKKLGFALPLDEWFRRELKTRLLDELSQDRLKDQGLFNPEVVGKIVSEHLSGRENWGHQLFSLLIFQLWRDSMKQVARSPGD